MPKGARRTCFGRRTQRIAKRLDFVVAEVQLELRALRSAVDPDSGLGRVLSDRIGGRIHGIEYDLDVGGRGRRPGRAFRPRQVLLGSVLR